MKNSKLKICSVQTVPELFDKDKNLEKADTFMKKAASSGAKAIVFPEMYLTGYVIDNLSELAETLEGPSIKRLADLAAQYKLLIVCGFPEKNRDGLPYNSACVIDADGSILGSYHKTHLFCEEAITFSPGESAKTFLTSIGNVGVMICYDTEFPEVARLLALDGAALILMLGANMFPYEEYHASFLRVRAMENSVFAASANFVGSDNVYEFCGRSAIVSPSGEYLSLGSLDKEELLCAEINLADACPADENINYLLHRRMDLYEPLLKDPRKR